MKIRTIFCIALLVIGVAQVHATGIAVGAAPKGDAVSIASRIIKKNFPECRRVTKATRAKDGSIHARCDKTDYLVFTLSNLKERKIHEVAMNCTAAKSLLDVSC